MSAMKVFMKYFWLSINEDRKLENFMMLCYCQCLK